MPDEVHFPPDPEAVTAVIQRDPCPECRESAFGWVTADDRGAVTVTAVAEYHADNCTVLRHGGYVIAVMPLSAVTLAGEMIKAMFREMSPGGRTEP